MSRKCPENVLKMSRKCPDWDFSLQNFHTTYGILSIGGSSGRRQLLIPLWSKILASDCAMPLRMCASFTIQFYKVLNSRVKWCGIAQLSLPSFAYRTSRNSSHPLINAAPNSSRDNISSVCNKNRNLISGKIHFFYLFFPWICG